MNKIILLLIIIIGIWLRIDCYNTRHPDKDELFELKSLQEKKITSIFDNKAFYGDHTSFPGEFLIYYLPLKIMGLFEKPVRIDVDRMMVDGLKRNDFWKLAIPKIIMCILSFWLLWLCCKSLMLSQAGTILAFSIYSFNFQLVYHAFEMRPYSALPFLAVLNLYLSFQWYERGKWLEIFHAIVIFLTCIYHAYGLLIAFLPLILAYTYGRRKDSIIYVCLASVLAWGFYAFYSHFGMTPNTMQSQVDPFQFMPKQFFLENLVKQLSGGSLIFYAIVPLLGWALLKKMELRFLVWLIIIPIVLICLIDIKTHYWIHPRQYVWVIPFFAIFCGKLVDKIIHER